jgi:hypothetical protein
MGVKYEQPDSAHSVLGRAGVMHGDTTKIRMAVGVPESGYWTARLAFCCSAVEVGDVLQPGSPAERAQPIGGGIVIKHRRKLGKKIAGQGPGIAIFEGTVHTNGHVTFDFDPNKTRFKPMPGIDVHCLRSGAYNHLANKALAEVAS